MEKDNSKLITLAFLIAGGLTWLVVGVLFESFSASFGAVAALRGNTFVLHGLPVGAGLAVFISLQFNKKIVEWANEVATEIAKIVWPSRKDTTAMTTVCCIMVLVAGVVFGIFDFFSSNLIKMLVN